MTDHAEKLKEIVEKTAGHSAGPWELWDGCSWRRFGVAGTSQLVIEPIVYSERDRHPDLRVSKPDAALVCAAPDLLTIATAQQAELVQLREALTRALPYVESQSESEHMLDGFGPRRERPSDVVLRIVRDILTRSHP